MAAERQIECHGFLNVTPRSLVKTGTFPAAGERASFRRAITPSRVQSQAAQVTRQQTRLEQLGNVALQSRVT